MNDPTTWPESLRAIVSAHGGERVFDVGLKTLGYPPTWVMEQATAARVIEAMKQEATN
jgi:hypothetical protein